jgi:hypothetical protein
MSAVAEGAAREDRTERVSCRRRTLQLRATPAGIPASGAPSRSGRHSSTRCPSNEDRFIQAYDRAAKRVGKESTTPVSPQVASYKITGKPE